MEPIRGAMMKKKRRSKNFTFRFKGRKYRVRKSGIYLILIVAALIVCAFQIPGMVEESKLKKLGYTSAEVKAMRTEKLNKVILKNGYYSAYLASSVKSGTVNADYLDLYASVTGERTLEAKDFLLANRLREKGYTEEQIDNLYKNLRFWEITPLLVFDYQYDESGYIKDCLAHKDTNSQDSFVLDNNYYSTYQNTLPVDDPSNGNLLVNKTYYLSDSYEPPAITDLSIQYASTGLQLAGTAAQGLEDFCKAGIAVGVRFYAVSAYRSYADQTTLYQNYVNSMGQETADATSARAGFSEHQTGYAVDLASVGNEGLTEYKDTNEYTWTSANCADYGWILRYPQGKEAITGYQFESWHYRYLGVQLAKAVSDSKLTYDEFYCLYLKPWDKDEDKPSQAILDAADYTKTESAAEPSAAASADTGQ